jgi:hypothetical protein
VRFVTRLSILIPAQNISMFNIHFELNSIRLGSQVTRKNNSQKVQFWLRMRSQQNELIEKHTAH